MRNKIIATLISMLCFVSIFCFSGCDENLTEHKIFVSASNENNGTITGEGIYKTNQTVTLTASPKNDNEFIAWVHNDIIVAETAEYSFVVTEDFSETELYTAIFTSNTLDYFVLKSATYSILGLENSNFTVQKITSSKISSSKTNSLYVPFAEANDIAIPNTGNVTLDDYSLTRKIFHTNQTYYFSLENIFAFNTVESDLLEPMANPISRYSFMIAEVLNGTTVGGITTFEDEEQGLTLTLKTISEINTLEITITDIQAHTSLPATTTQTLKLVFTYPIETTDEN